jgi:myosin heavy subunit
VCGGDIQVSYDTGGFLEKNRDTLGSDILAAVQTSKLQLVLSLFPDKVDIGGKKPPTVGMQFKVPTAQSPTFRVDGDLA